MSDHDPARPEEPDPLEQLFGGPVPPQMRESLEALGLGAMDPAQLAQMRQQMEMLLGGSSADDGPINAELAHDVARQAVAEQGGDASIGDSTRRDVAQVVQVATLWLDQVTDFPPPEGQALALSRAEWVERTLPLWTRLTAPVAEGLQTALGAAMGEQLGQLGESGTPIPGLPPGMNPAELMGQMQPMVRRMSAGMFGGQVGQAVGALAGETVSGTEVGIPLLGDESVALLPANVRDFAEGLDIDAGEVHLYLAVREAARVRLFAAVPWLGPQLLAAVEAYARDIRINTEGIEEAVRSADPQDAEAMQEALAGGLFDTEPSPAQQAALLRLETLLALVEGWVDVVTERAAGPHLPHAAALSEAVRRRRATGGPAEKAFASLVGLELRPRRLRDAANLWSAVEDAEGPEGRDSAWAHPDVAPSAEDLDDPLGFVQRRRSGTGPDLDLDGDGVPDPHVTDEDIARLLDGELGKGPGDGRADGGRDGTGDGERPPAG